MKYYKYVSYIYNKLFTFSFFITFFYYIFQTVYNKDSASIKLLSQPRVLGDAMQNFHQHLIEITFEVSAQKLLLRNYVDDVSGKI